MKEQKNPADPAQYCKFLTDPPVDNDRERECQTWYALELYNCALTQEPCIARDIEDRTKPSDVWGYAIAKIDERKLEKCPCHNIPVEIAKQTLVAKINAERDTKIEKLEQRLKNLDKPRACPKLEV